MFVGVALVEKDGGKEMLGGDIVVKELERGAINNEMNEDLWIQLATIEKEWRNNLENMKIIRVAKDAQRMNVI